MRRRLAGLALLVCQAAGAPDAGAATTCTATQPSLGFGTVSVAGMTDATGTFSVTCQTVGLSLAAQARVRMCLGITDGAAGGGNFNPRRMLNGTADALQFQIYSDAARSQIWGARGNATIPSPVLADFEYAVPLLGGSQTQNFTLYGRVPAQTFIAGSYANAFTGIHTAIEYRYAEQLLGTPPFPASCTSGGSAGTSSTFPFTATATVPSDCRSYITTNLDFGTVPGLIGNDIDNASTVTMTCTGRTAWNVALDNGQNASGSTRRMRLPATGNYVTYELYQTAARTQRWGNTLGTDTVPGTGTGSAQTLTVYGRVPAAQSVPAGNYSDTITVTISY